MTAVRFGVVGTGMMGCEHLRNLLPMTDVVVTAVSDPNDEPLRWAELTLGDSWSGVVAFRDHRELLASGLVDAVVVASPNHTHRAVLDDILATDVHVLVEKPMCTTVDDCKTVVAGAESRRAVTWVGLEYRYMPPIARLLESLRAGDIGNLKMLAIREHRFPFLVKVDNWNRFTRNTGGTLVEKCCHFFDLMNLAIGSRPARVYASGGQDVNHLDEVYDGQRSDILDNAYVVIDYDNGVRAMLDLSMFAEGGRNEQEIVAVGDTGKLEAAVPGDGNLHLGRRADRSVTTIPVTAEEVGHVGFHHGASYVELRRFIDAIRGDGPVEVDTTAGLWSVVVGAAAHRSIDERRPVDISEFGL
ncbi:MAG: Gfo/Idh/MocA family oxidoreductase [Ilumatobacteraceae bacterium]|nr:Gfo/Idh/MocA family oxidoreductase [Ilumatobacteraceae bacterium]